MTAPGPQTAALMFRVGHADEPPSWGGVTHLVEHLALSKLDDPSYGYNGFVDQTRTVFHARGSTGQVEDFLRRVAANLVDLPAGTVARERRVLAAEGVARSGSAVDELLGLRFGPGGYGRIAYDEFGLHWLGDADVVRWRDRYFTAGNAVLMMTGRPPESLGLELPHGARVPAPPPQPVWPARPLWTARPISGTAMGLVQEGSGVRGAAPAVLERRLRRELRFERSLSYNVSVTTSDLGGTMHTVVQCDAAEGHEQEVVDAVLHTITCLRRDGATPEELADVVDRGIAVLAEPDYPVVHLDWVAGEALHGREVIASEERLQRLREVSGEDVRRVIDDGMRAALLLVPPACVPQAREFAPIDWRSPAVRDGRVLAPSAEGLAAGVDHTGRLVLSDETLSLQSGLEATFSIHLPTCALALRSNDGIRVVFAPQGTVIGVCDWQWEDGEAALAHIDGHAPAESLVEVDEGVLTVAWPEQTLQGHTPQDLGPARPSLWSRVVYVSGSALLGILAVGFVLLTVAPELDDTGETTRGTGAVGALVCIGAWLLLARWHRRRRASP